MKDALKLIAATTIFCLFAGVLLVWTDRVTKGPIEVEKGREFADSLARVLPPPPGPLALQSFTGGAKRVFHVARSDRGLHGVAARSVSQRGYGGKVELLVGIGADDRVSGVRILEAHETPGLGSKASEPAFLGQFANRPALDAAWSAVRKDKGEIDAITGATITSRAVCEAVKSALDDYCAEREALRGPAAPAAELGGGN